MAITEKKLNTLEINRLTRTQYNGASSLNPDAIYIEDPEFAGNKLLMTNSAGEIVEADASANDIPGVINNVTSTSTGDALSANMGRELQEEINNLKSLGRFLALWNCATGLAQSDPITSPRPYHAGDYFVVGTIAASGANNYRPNGTQYVIGVASTVVETAEVAIGDVYYYDGNGNWRLQSNSQKEITFANIAGQPSDNTNLAAALDSKLENVKINGTALTVTDKAVNIPLAASGVNGVVNGSVSSYGIEIVSPGVFGIKAATTDNLITKTNGRNPVVSSNLDIAVREGLGNNQLTWTEEYKTSARNTIGATKVTWNFYED